MRAEGHRGPASSALQQKGLPSHKCSYCSHSTHYLEVLWMHQTVAHRINSSALAPKWALLKNGFKGPREGSSSRRRTGPPPALDGRECPPLPPVVRTPRTHPPLLNRGQKKDSRDRATSQPSTSSSSTQGSTSSASGSQSVRPPRAGSSRQRGEAVPDQGQRSRSNSRPRVEIYPRGGSSTGSLEKSTAAGAHQRPSAPSPSVGGTTRLVERYMLPQEGLGFMLSSKHGLAEYSRARSSPQPQPKPKPRSSQSHTQSHPQSQGRPRAERPAHNTTTAGQGYGAFHSQTHGSAVQVSSTSSSSSSSAQRAEMKQEEARGVETPELPMDILSFLKSCNSNDLATLYHRWGAANPLLDPTGKSQDRAMKQP